MQFTKKFDRAFQWAGEKMGNEAKTSMSDDFKNLETEMALRHDGMDRLQKSMNVYVKSVSKRCETSEDKEKGLPIGYMGRTMAAHGEDFEPDSEFGNCLIVLGRANEQLASTQEVYVQQATAYWLESLERSLAMMKEYQSARRKLENRRLAYDASMTKVQKAKREDFRLEDELRGAKAKYEESSEDVLRRMQDIKEAEAETVQDLTSFLDAELDYHERCVEELRRARQQWPAGGASAAAAVPVIRGPRPDAEPPAAAARRPSTRSRSGTAHSYSDRTERWASSRDIYEEDEAEAAPPAPGPRPAIRSQGRLSVSGAATPTPVSPPRPGISRSSTYGGGTFEGPAATAAAAARSPSYREPPPLPQDSGMRKANTTPAAVVAPPPNIGSLRGNLRPVSRISTGGGDVFGDDYDTATSHSGGSPEYDRAESPATSYGSLSRTTSNVALQQQQQQQQPSTKKAPPPPPPSRAKKPPPPIPQKSGLIR